MSIRPSALPKETEIGIGGLIAAGLGPRARPPGEVAARQLRSSAVADLLVPSHLACLRPRPGSGGRCPPGGPRHGGLPRGTDVVAAGRLRFRDVS
jgi:hypothetical protein